MAERHVREGEARIARQVALIATLAAEQSRQLLANLQTTLNVARDQLRIKHDVRAGRAR